MTNKIKEFRKKKNLTQQELADLACVSRQAIIAIERGSYNPSTILSLKLSKILDTTVENIFFLDEDD